MRKVDGSPFQGLVLIRKYPSKKNSVYLVDRKGSLFILKVYGNDRWKVESEVLARARRAGIRVPGIIEVKEKAILMEYIRGNPVNDYLGTNLMEEMVLGVASWLAGFHRAFRAEDMVLLKSDAIFKNFIVADGIYGIDFELSHMGRPEEDVGEALAYLLDTDPMFTDDKFRIGASFIESYEKESGIVLRDIEEYIASSLRYASRFRPARRELLLKKAEEIMASRPFTFEHH